MSMLQNEDMKKALAEHDIDTIREIADTNWRWTGRTCPVCGSSFLPTYKGQGCCSLSCANVMKWRVRKALHKPKTKRKSIEHGIRSDAPAIPLLPESESCIRCSRPREPGSMLCKYHIKMAEKKSRLR